MELSKNRKQSEGNWKSPQTETGSNEGQRCRGHSPLGTLTVNENNTTVAPECLPVPNTLGLPSPELSPSLSDGWMQFCASDCVKKSRTHSCVKLSDSPASPDNGDRTWTPIRCHCRRLVNSASFSGFGVTHRLVRENQNAPANNREISDYCNLTPQVPFVPSIAKSIPKKGIFLRRPKKAIKGFIVHNKHSCGKAASPCTPCSHYGPTLERTKKSSRRPNRTRPCQKGESFSDSSSECCTNIGEDAVSLKSFGSQAGCGEIFADEEYVVSLEGMAKPEMYQEAPETLKESPVAFAVQGGDEQLASPGQTEILDLFGMWETINRTILFGQSSNQVISTTSTPISMSPLSSKTASDLGDLSNSTSNAKTICMGPEMVTPKSENHESTSDEGYCDYASSEDHTRQSVSPVYSSRIPRDSYSGDALYELFYEPSEAEMTPIFDEDMDLTHGIIGLPSPDLPLSMYSFHVGSEENLAPPLAVDLISQDFLQSNWMGKDCLLKLCDTEISLAMGLVNWFKRRSIKGNQEELISSGIIAGDNGGQCQDDKIQTRDLKNKPSNAALKPVYCRENTIDLKVSNQCQVITGRLLVDPPKQDGVVSSETAPSNQPRTPTSRVCFRIFNINSPSTPTKDLASPVACSPGSGTSSLFVLAINKESLCESCKTSLNYGAKELHLCHSCTAFIEHIKSPELWSGASLYQSQTTGSPQSMTGGFLLSPCSSYGVASDISIYSVVEQCANQMSSLKINKNQKLSDSETAAATEQVNDEQPKKDCSRKYDKSKHKKRNTTASGLLPVGNKKHHAVHSSSLLGAITPEVSQASRPSSLPLPNATSLRVKEKPRESLRRDREANKGVEQGLLDNVVPEEKPERRRKMKK